MNVKFRTAFPALTLALAASFSGAVAHAQAPSGSTLENDLKAKYKPDSVLVVQKDGIIGNAPSNALPACPSNFKDNSLHPPNALCLMAEKSTSKALTNGEKVHPTSVSINWKAEKVAVNFTECDSCNGGDASSYKGEVVFQFPKSYLEGADAGQVADVIGQVLAPPDPNAPQQDQNQQQAGGQQAGGQQQGGDQQQQPQQPAAPPASIQLGQTIDQVQASFGPPEKIVNLGTKQIYVYKDLKVTFVNGKVTDVQ
jgi:hypothetical protein